MSTENHTTTAAKVIQLFPDLTALDVVDLLGLLPDVQRDLFLRCARAVLAEPEQTKLCRTDLHLVLKVLEAEILHERDGLPYNAAAKRVGLSYEQFKSQRRRYTLAGLIPPRDGDS